MPETRSRIVSRNAKVLRATAQPVPKKMFGSAKLNDIIASMKKALHREDDGVAIAAPQIGESLRIFIVNGQTLAALAQEKAGGEAPVVEDLVCINPEIVSLSRKRLLVEEGCLSLRWLYGKVNRSEKAKIKAQDPAGKTFTLGASGLLAQIFQHETDHLDGVLFTDKAIDIVNLPPEHEHEGSDK